MALVVTIAGNNRTSVVKYGSLAVEQQAANFITVCSLILIDEAGDIAIAAEDTITLIDGGTTFFTGRVVEVRYSLFTVCSRFIKLKCQDLNYQLIETVIDQEEEFPGGAGHAGITADADIIDHLFDDYLPGVTTDDFAKNQTIQDPLTITFSPTTLRSMLSQICTRTGGYFYVDFDNDLHYFEAETSGVAWWLTDDPIRDAPATNLIKNPSIETNTTFWAANSCVISRDVDYSVFGDYALKVVTANVFAIEGPYADVNAETAINTEYTFSCYLRGAGTVRLYMYDPGGGAHYSPTITLTGTWTRYSLTATFGAGIGRLVGVYTNVQQDITFYCDGFQLEQAALASSYFDGSFGTDFAWTGAAHASTSTRGARATSFFEASLDKTTLATTRLDGVFVIGADVSGWRGVHTPGDRQGIARDNRITTATGIQNRGDAILARYGDAQETYTVKIYQAGLRAGMVVLFICELYGVNGTFTIRKMVIKWDGCGDAYYILTLGDVVNPSLITERNWVDGLVSAIGPITAPMLPTSSRGWIHDIVFVAADFDTVTWAGAKKITLADGTEYTINAGTTGNMEADTVHYIYLDIDTSIIALQVTHASATAVGTHKLLIAVAAPVADEDTNKAILQVFGGEGIGVMITADNIVAETITGNEINANSIAAGHIIAGAIETDKLDALAVTAAKIAANTITADKIEMGIGDALYNNADGLLLFGPYCEISPTEWWSLRKQKATLSGAFHQEAGRWLGTRGLMVEAAVTNRITNPSIEIDTTSWIAIGSTRTRDTTYSMFGAAALKVVTDNAAAGEGAAALTTTTTAADTEYTFSVHLRGSGTVRLLMWDTNGGFQFGDVITLTGVWVRHQITKTYSDGADRSVGIYTNVQQGLTFYVDGFQLEASDYATSYCDGSLGTGYAWTGAAHASTSTRLVTEVNLDEHTGLVEADSTQSFRVVVQAAYDYDAEWPVDFPVIMDIYEDVNNRILILFSQAANKIYATVESGGITASMVPAAETVFSAGDWLDIVLTVNFATDVYTLYLDGVELAADATVLGLIAALSEWNLGSNRLAASQAGWNIAEFAAFDNVLSEIEVAGMYALTTPLVDTLPLDSPGLYILDGRFRISSSTTGNRIEITSEEVAGYDSAGVLQFELRSSDGKALAGAGAVVLDEDGLYTVGDGVGLSTKFNLYYDDTGTLRRMGRIYGAYAGGAVPTYLWLNAMRGAGDPWNGAVAILQASDSVAGTDVRITVSSNNRITMGINAADRIGLGTGAPVAKVHIGQTDPTGAISVLHLDQTDVSERMVDFACTIGVGNAIEAVGGKTLTVTHFIKIGGTVGTKYIPVGTIA